MTINSQMSGVVELCGLPGSGKSHLTQRLTRELTSRGVTVHLGGVQVSPDVPTPLRMGRKLALVGAQCATRPLSSARIAARIATSGQRNRHDVVARVVQWLGTEHLVRSARRTAGLHLFDEGVVQALWSVGLRGDVSGMLHWLESRHSWARPDLIVLVAAPLDVVHARLNGRSSRHSRVQAQAEPEIWAELDRGQVLLDEIADWWRHRFSAGSLLRWMDSDTQSGQAAVANLAERLLLPR
jgi:hypothetical protein